MNTHFNNTPPANASAATLVEVVTDDLLIRASIRR